MAKQEERFVITYQQSTLTTETGIPVDRTAGVNDLYHKSAGSGGSLLDREGRGIVTGVCDAEH